MSHKKSSLRAATQALIMGLALTTSGAGAVVLAAPAAAIDAPVSLPDGSKDVSLTIYKRLLGDTDSRGKATGDKDDTVAGQPLKGVKFSVQRLNYDLTTAEGLKNARNATIADAEANIAADGQPTAAEFTTDDEGKIVLNKDQGMKVGAYLVKETDASNATLNGEKKSGIVKANPFIVFLPMTDTNGKTADGSDIATGARTTWQYNVVAYPKNTETKVGKVLEDADNSTVQQNQAETTNLNGNVGDKITYVLDYTRPNVDKTDQNWTYWEMYDRVPKNLKVEDTAALENTVTEVKLGDEVLVKDTDYVLKYEDSVTEANVPEGATTDARPEVQIVLTKYGLSRLGNAAAGTKITAKYTFVVDPDADENGTFEAVNDGGVKQQVEPGPTPEVPTTPPDTPDVPDKPENPDNPITPKVESYWVKVNLLKYNADKDRDSLEAKDKLEGAEFDLYRCKKDANQLGGHELLSQITVKKAGDGIYKTDANGTDKVITNADGHAEVQSLRFRKALADDANQGYCLVETKAPDGYQLMTDPIFFKITEANKTVDANVDAPNVPDHDDDRPHLPATGGAGVYLLLLLGASILGAGAWFARRNSKANA